MHHDEDSKVVILFSQPCSIVPFCIDIVEHAQARHQDVTYSTVVSERMVQADACSAPLEWEGECVRTYQVARKSFRVFPFPPCPLLEL